MSWKCIGAKSIGTSHIQNKKACEDAYSFQIVNYASQDVLIAIISDGAGSAKYAEQASKLVTIEGVQYLKKLLDENHEINSSSIYSLAEYLYSMLEVRASSLASNINEFSCTFLGCILFSSRSVLFQIGDGIIVQGNNLDFYSCIWIPQNGEYYNTTNFLVDDMGFGNLNIKELDYSIDEIAITTDGLQTLILKNESNEIHQPFFTNLYKWLRMAKTVTDIKTLDLKLNDYLGSNLINSRTDDDKTLFLATRISV